MQYTVSYSEVCVRDDHAISLVVVDIYFCLVLGFFWITRITVNLVAVSFYFRSETMAESSTSTGGIVTNSPIIRSSTSSDGSTVKMTTVQMDGTNCLE